MPSIEQLLTSLCDVSASFHARGHAFGSTGNISVRSGQRVWITPTGKSLKALTPDQLAEIDVDGNSFGANKPSKEYPFHLAAYRAAGDRANAIVHLHPTYSVALSCLENLDEAAPMPIFTPYYLMRVAPLAVLPYFRPGSDELAQAVGQASASHNSLLLRNHGMICLGTTMEEAVDRTEELEETAKLYFLLRGEKVRNLTGLEQDDIARVFLKK